MIYCLKYKLLVSVFLVIPSNRNLTILSQTDERELNIQMQRRYTIAEMKQTAVSSIGEDALATPLLEQATPLLDHGLKRKASDWLGADDADETDAGVDVAGLPPSPPEKYVRPCDQTDEAEGTTIAVPTAAQQELQSAAFRSRLDTMISHYENPTSGAAAAAPMGPVAPPRGLDDKDFRPMTPEASVDKSSPSSLQPTPIKEPADATYFSQPRPLNYELSSPKATVGL